MDSEQNLTTCIEEIAEQFLFDSIVLLDRVLEDDLHDPQYSANPNTHKPQELIHGRQLLGRSAHCRPML